MHILHNRGNMAYSFMSRRIFSLLICIGSVLFSNYSADLSSDHVASEISKGNISEENYIYKGTVMPKKYKAIANTIENFEVRDDDVWICTFSRSGTTWAQEMIWLIANDLDFDGARTLLGQRSPFLEFSAIKQDTPADALKSLENIARLPSPRIIKTHLPFDLLPRQLTERQKKAKMIHVLRNPKDVSVSLYHHRRLRGYSGTLANSSRELMDGTLVYLPYWNHVNGYLQRRGDENILFLTFEDMKSDLRSQIKRAAEFLGKTLNDQQINDLKNHLDFKNMQTNPAVNAENTTTVGCKENPCEEKFIRKGEVGQWKTEMSKELIEEFDDWIQANSKE